MNRKGEAMSEGSLDTPTTAYLLEECRVAIERRREVLISEIEEKYKEALEALEVIEGFLHSELV